MILAFQMSNIWDFSSIGFLFPFLPWELVLANLAGIHLWVIITHENVNVRIAFHVKIL